MAFFLRLFVVLCVAAAMSVTSFGQKITTSAQTIAESGSFNGQLYSNTALEFSILAPGGWNFWSSDQNTALVDKNRERAAVSYDNKLKNSAANTQVLFQAEQRSMKGVERKAMLSCGVERLQTTSTTNMYIAASKDLMLRTSGVKITRDIYSLTLGGVSFGAFDVEGTISGSPFRQRIIGAVRRNAALFFVITLYDKTQDEMIEHSLQSIKFR